VGGVVVLNKGSWEAWDDEKKSQTKKRTKPKNVKGAKAKQWKK